MTRWDRARPGVAYTCGNCGDVIPEGKPMLVITVNGPTLKVKRDRYRDEKCAGPAPPDLPELVVLADKPLVPLVGLAQLLPLDWRAQRAGGDR